MFPSLITCCTIDWFSEWPDEALQSVAFNFLGEITDIDTSNQELLSGNHDVLCIDLTDTLSIFDIEQVMKDDLIVGSKVSHM